MALSELVVAGLGIPVMLLLSIGKIRSQQTQAQAESREEE